MRHKLVVIFLSFMAISSKAQTTNTLQQMTEFTKIWGLLKYYHHGVGQGSIDWDSVFISRAKHILSGQSTAEFNEQLRNIFNAIGRPGKSVFYEDPDSLFLKNEVTGDWILTSKILKVDAQKYLLEVFKNPACKTNRFIKVSHQNADFSGEKIFAELFFPNAEHRLLFLARYWNIINYYAPYKYLTTNWDKVLERFIPEMIRVADTLSYYRVLAKLCKSVNDGHAQLTLKGDTFTDDLFFGKNTPPFYCQIIDGKVVVRSLKYPDLANSINVKVGDIIQKLDNVDLGAVIKNRRMLISASNYLGEMHDLSKYILDGNSSTVELQIKRGTQVLKTKVPRYSTTKRDWAGINNYTVSDSGYKKIDDSILVIYTMQVWDGNISRIRQLVSQAKAVILDVRNYPSNDAFYELPGLFLEEPKSIDLSTIALPSLPGIFKWKLNPHKTGYKNRAAFKGPVVILCDERTQSQGEYSCMVLQTIPQSVTIGRQTAGADGVNTSIPMGGGVMLSYSCYGVYYPDKTQTQRVGVKIDIPIKKTVDDVRDERDEIMEAALRYIAKGR